MMVMRSMVVLRINLRSWNENAIASQRSCWLNSTALRSVLALALLVLPGGMPGGTRAGAESALELISGFDTQRLAGCYPVVDASAAGEMSKLLFRLRKTDAKEISSRSQPDAVNQQPGDAVQLVGTILSIRQFQVPASLVEFLDLKSFQEIVMRLEASGEAVLVFAPSLVGKVNAGDRLETDAVYLESSDQGAAYATGHVRWVPATAQRIGWRLLARQGVDLNAIVDAASRNGRPLQAADGDAFYTLLAAAKSLDKRGFDVDQSSADPSTEPSDDPTTIRPEAIRATDLLQRPQDYHGQWIRIDASTIRITRIAVTDPGRRQQLGQDHYFQIDANGDLGKTIVQLQRNEGETQDPIRISGTYPMSLVSTVLPDFLVKPMEDRKEIVAMVSHPVSIEGFFYRMWSYKNEFMTREGGSQQIGPLIVVSDWQSLIAADQGGQGVRWIGWAFSFAIVLAVITTVLWSRHNAAGDARARDRGRGIAKIEI